MHARLLLVLSAILPSAPSVLAKQNAFTRAAALKSKAAERWSNAARGAPPSPRSEKRASSDNPSFLTAKTQRM